jgi:hypothetical protein
LGYRLSGAEAPPKRFQSSDQVPFGFVDHSMALL